MMISNIGEPVDWSKCVYCGGTFESDSVECRVWGMKDKKVGVAHQSCATLQDLKLLCRISDDAIKRAKA